MISNAISVTDTPETKYVGNAEQIGSEEHAGVMENAGSAEHTRSAAPPAAAVRGRPKVAGLAERRREQILIAATRCFAEHGYHEMDVQVLANELKTGKGTIYRYFPSKQELFLAAVDRVMQRMREAVDAARAIRPDSLEQIADAIHSYLAFFDAHPEFVELLIQERAVFKDRKKPTYFEHREKNVGRWQSLYLELMDAGRVRRMPPDVITDVMSSALYGTMFTNFFAGRAKSLEAQARQIVDVVFHGILAEERHADASASVAPQAASPVKQAPPRPFAVRLGTAAKPPSATEKPPAAPDFAVWEKRP